MLHPRIVEVSTDKATGESYFLVSFWKSKAARTRDEVPLLEEDFVMALRPTGTRLIDEGNPTLGSESYARDLEAEIMANITRYAEEAERLGYAGDNTSRSGTAARAFSVGGKEIRARGKRIFEPRVRDNSDPHGVLAKPEVTALRGKDLDLAAVGP